MTVIMKPEPTTSRPPRPVGALTTDTMKTKVSKANKIRKVVNRYLDETANPDFIDFLEWLDCIK